MEYTRFDVNDKSTYPKNGDYLVWVDNETPVLATFHTKAKYGSHWWEYEDIDDLDDDYVTCYVKLEKPKKNKK